MFHLTRNAVAHLQTVSGELRPARQYEMPVFDDKASFEVYVSNGMVSITPDALAAMMNEYVFARHDSPMKDISIKIKEDRLVIKGKLHSKGDLPFETGGQLTVNADGRLRLHSEKVKALHVPVKKVMSLIGIELANVINTSKIPGMDTDKNDLIFDLGDLLPPPHMRGKITTALLRRNEIILVYGNTEAAANGAIRGNKFAASDAATGGEKRDVSLSGNYMAFRGNGLKFGKLTMENSDLTVIDLDERDPLDWDQDRYKDQLVAGYSKTTEQFGLLVFVKDFAKLAKSPGGARPAHTKTGQQ
jgi:hypothetical protein